MMTGQILGGTPPALAARYQICVMFLIAASAALSVTGVATLAVHACTDGAHRLHAAALTRKPAAESGGLDPVRFVARQGAAAVAAARAWLARRRAARRDVDEPLLPDDTPLAAAT